MNIFFLRCCKHKKIRTASKLRWWITQPRDSTRKEQDSNRLERVAVWDLLVGSGWRGGGVVRFVTSHKGFCVCFAPSATLQLASLLLLLKRQLKKPFEIPRTILYTLREVFVFPPRQEYKIVKIYPILVLTIVIQRIIIG